MCCKKIFLEQSDHLADVKRTDGESYSDALFTFVHYSTIIHFITIQYYPWFKLERLEQLKCSLSVRLKLNLK